MLVEPYFKYYEGKYGQTLLDKLQTLQTGRLELLEESNLKKQIITIFSDL